MNPRGRTRADWADQLIAASTIARPKNVQADTEAPVPVIFQLHGCGGIRPFMTGYAESALAAGVAAITVDSFKPRGLNRLSASCLVCTGVHLRGDQRAADVFALFDWARRQAWIDPDRIAFAGWSHGAWAIMDALALGARAGRATGLTDLPADPLEGLSAAVLIYTYAGFPSLTTHHGWGGAKPNVSALVCGKDQVVGHRLPSRALDRLERDGVPVTRIFYPDATHAFDDPDPNDPRGRHRPDLFEQTRAWYAERLKAAFAL